MVSQNCGIGFWDWMRSVNSMYLAKIRENSFGGEREPSPPPPGAWARHCLQFNHQISFFTYFQGKVTSMLPIKIIGSACNMVHLCLLHALYSFEYKWFSQVVLYFQQQDN